MTKFAELGTDGLGALMADPGGRSLPLLICSVHSFADAALVACMIDTPSKLMVISLLVSVTVHPKLQTADSENRLCDNTLFGNTNAVTVSLLSARTSCVVPTE